VPTRRESGEEKKLGRWKARMGLSWVPGVAEKDVAFNNKQAKAD
jgi:hypothetical protein